MSADISNAASRGWLRYPAALAAFLVVCLAAWYAAAVRPVTDAPWYGIMPPLLAVIAALVTGRMLLSLIAAVLVGGLLAAWPASESLLGAFAGGLPRAWQFVYLSVLPADFSILSPGSFEVTDAQLILAYVILIMAAIAVVLVSGGLQGVADGLARLARGRRSTQVVTALAGLVIFIDDYANTMIVGSTMRPVTDRHGISREKLAFLVDATAAPIAGIALISTWVGYEVGLLGEVAGTLGIDKVGYAMFFDALGFRFYCITMIAFVMLGAAIGVDYGPMAAAERRAREQGGAIGDHSHLSPMEMARSAPHAGARIHAATAVLPMLAMLVVFITTMWVSGGGNARWAADPAAPLRISVWREVFSTANSIPLLVWASGAGLIAACLCALLIAQTPARATAGAAWVGLKASMLPVSVLILAWSLKGACEMLETGRFLADQLQGAIPPWLFPMLVFAVAGATAFSTGTSWGTMAILIPTAVPVAFALDGGVYGTITIVTIAAILDGAIFGDHCSPISDTTIMSSAASACNHLAHVKTQLPYSLTVAAMALAFGYLPAGLGIDTRLDSFAAVAACAVLFAVLWYRQRTTLRAAPNSARESQATVTQVAHPLVEPTAKRYAFGGTKRLGNSFLVWMLGTGVRKQNRRERR